MATCDGVWYRGQVVAYDMDTGAACNINYPGYTIALLLPSESRLDPTSWLFLSRYDRYGKEYFSVY